MSNAEYPENQQPVMIGNTPIIPPVGDIPPAISSASSAEPASGFICEACGSAFASAMALKAHSRAHKPRKSVTEPSQSEQSELQILKERLATEETQRKLAEESLKKLQAERQLAALSTMQPEQDRIGKALERLIEVRTIAALGNDGGSQTTQQSAPPVDPSLMTHIQELEEELRTEKEERARREEREAQRRETNELRQDILKLADGLRSEIKRVEELTIKREPQSHSGSDLLISEVGETGRQLLGNLKEKTEIVENWLLNKGTQKPLIETSENPDIETLRQMGLVKDE